MRERENSEEAFMLQKILDAEVNSPHILTIVVLID